jgi:hypothetical protein
MPEESLGMFGERLDKLVCIRCRICGRFTAIRLDAEDLRRHTHDGTYVQDAFIRRDGTAYLSASERELVLTQTCESCWQTLCCPRSQFGWD